MTPDEMIGCIQKRFPSLQQGGAGLNSNAQPDFSIEFRDCLAEFFCSNTTSLDFVLMIKDGGNPRGGQRARAVAATEGLVRTCEGMLAGLCGALRKGALHRKPRISMCVVEDPNTRSTILVRGTPSPLRSPGGKLAFGLAALWLIVGVGLVIWQVSVDQSQESMRTNVLAVALSLGLAALGTPMPTIAAWRDWKRIPIWRDKGADT
jgi:hypothetical protein